MAGSGLVAKLPGMVGIPFSDLIGAAGLAVVVECHADYPADLRSVCHSELDESVWSFLAGELNALCIELSPQGYRSGVEIEPHGVLPVVRLGRADIPLALLVVGARGLVIPSASVVWLR